MDSQEFPPLNPQPMLQKTTANLTKIIPAEQLLSADEKRMNLIKLSRDMLGWSEEQHKSLGLESQIASNYQSLPDSANNYYSQPGGMLDYALNRAEAALSLFNEHVLNPDDKIISDENKLWQYALYSAALLKGVGKLYVDLRVDLYDAKENFLKTWMPLSDSLTATGSYYCYEFQKESEKEFRCRLNLLLGRVLMPATGFAMIASNPEVLAVWLALLQEDFHGAGVLGSILLYADAIAVQRDIYQLMWKYHGTKARYYGRVSTFGGGGGESTADAERYMGLEFIQWLNRALDAGRISMNQAPLQMVPGGLIMLPDAFKLFVREHPEFKNWQAVQNGLTALGLGSSVAADGTLITQYGIALPKKFHVGGQGVVSAVALIHATQGDKPAQSALPKQLPGLHQRTSGITAPEVAVTKESENRPASTLWGKA